MRTVKEPDVRKQEILDGAIRVFAENGYDKTTIAGIAKELKISQGLCYRYFASKEDIYDAAIEKYAGLIVAEYLKSRPAEMPIRDWIDSIAAGFGTLARAEAQDEHLYALFHGSNSEKLHNQLVLKVAAQILPHVQEVLQKAQQKGEISIDNVQNIAIIGLYGELGVLFAPELSQEERVNTVKTAWYRLLAL